jgi:hypothetical protein
MKLKTILSFSLLQERMSEQLTVVYSNPENLFMAGFTVDGTVVVTAHKMIRVKQLYIEIKCDANTGWINKASDKIYESTEVGCKRYPYLFSNRKEPEDEQKCTMSLRRSIFHSVRENRETCIATERSTCLYP